MLESVERQWRQAVRNIQKTMQQQQLEVGPSTTTIGSSLLAGVATFGAVSAASCAGQRALGLSTGTLPPVPTVAGLATVAAASLASHWAAASVAAWYHHNSGGGSGSIFSRPQQQLVSSLHPHHHQSLRYFSYKKEDLHTTLRVCVVGLLAFKLLGGRFWAVAPSSYTNVGSFARASLPASENYASTSQRAVLDRLGRTWGCHTCGSRRLLIERRAARFVGDHMPPKSVARQLDQRWYRRLLRRPPTQFRFYPQCVPCSNQQGSLLSAATRQSHGRLAAAGGGANAHVHGCRPRVSHLAGGVVAALAVDLPLVKEPVDRVEGWWTRTVSRVRWLETTTTTRQWPSFLRK